jgi:polyvinyl alcohol dehydrogenase (cytochrome)
LLAAAAVLGFALLPGAADAQAPDASAHGSLFDRHCAVCHDNPSARAPARSSLRAMSPNLIVDSLTNGAMKSQGSVLTPEERVALAEYLTGRKVGDETPIAGKCAAASPPLSLNGPLFNGWSANVENWRFQPNPGLSAADLPRLELTWAFGVPGAILCAASRPLQRAASSSAARMATSTRSTCTPAALTGTTAQPAA